MTTSVAKASKSVFQDQAIFKRSYWSLGKVITLLLLLGISILFIIPLLWMISTSLKEAQDLVGFRWIPTRLAWENYIDAFSFGMWPQWTLNTVIITVLSVIGQVLSSSLVAYAFARLRWRGRDLLFSLVLATMMLPSVVTMIPQFVLFANLPAFGFMGSKVWVNTFLPLIVPAFTAPVHARHPTGSNRCRPDRWRRGAADLVEHYHAHDQTRVGGCGHLYISGRLAGLYGTSALLAK
jgi:multiple sugar transport system permease protein